MNFRVPEQVIDSSDDETSSQFQETHTMSEETRRATASNEETQNISHQMSGTRTPYEQPHQSLPQHDTANATNMQPGVYQNICEQITHSVMNQIQNLIPQLIQSQVSSLPQGSSPQAYPAQVPATASSTHERKPSKWPVWDGSAVAFEAHIFNLRVKIEEDRQFLGSDRSICLSIFNSIPTDKQPRIMQWYRNGGSDGSYNWELFLAHITDQLENKQARQTARSQLQRMRMGKNQLFVDFLQDFELKITQCNCSHWSDDSKISLLESGINHTLRNILLKLQDVSKIHFLINKKANLKKKLGQSILRN